MKEAAARIKINKLLEAASWRFFADAKGPANIQLEPSVTLKAQDLDALGENFEKATKGFIDFLLLNEKSFPFIVLEAKAEDKNPLIGKEKARRYARSQNCRFVILSNGNLHYFWDLERGNPCVITAFPTPTSVTGFQKTTPDPKRLIEEAVGDDLLFNRTNSFEHVGRTGIFDLEGEYCFASYLIRLTIANGKADPFFVNAFMNSDSFQQGIKQFASRAIGQSNINAKSLSAYAIPLPPLATQQAIVAEIEAEQALVAANRELISRFEQKIQATLARVWGKDEG